MNSSTLFGSFSVAILIFLCSPVLLPWTFVPFPITPLILSFLLCRSPVQPIQKTLKSHSWFCPVQPSWALLFQSAHAWLTLSLTSIVLLSLLFCWPDFTSLSQKPAKFKFRKENFETLNLALETISWAPLLSTLMFDQAFNTFYSILLDLFPRYVPSSRKSPRSYPVWFTTEVLKTWKLNIRNSRNPAQISPSPNQMLTT